MLLAGAVEIDGDGPGRIRLGKIENFSAASLHGFVAANVAQGATIKTDGWAAYPGAPGVDHDPHVVGAMAAHVVLPWTHRVFSNLKSRAHGLRDKHLQSYLDEFVFRFNRRRSRHAAFSSLFTIALAAKPVTYKMLIEPDAAE